MPQTSSIETRDIDSIINLTGCPIESPDFRADCRSRLDASGALVLTDFLNASAIDAIRQEGDANKHLAFFTNSNHNVYLQPTDTDLPEDHPRNRTVVSSKGCITTDQIPADSYLRGLYDSEVFRDFLCEVLNVESLYEYADPLSSINLHYASNGQELGWHFDNSSFAITLLIQSPEEGGEFEYIKNIRNAESGDMNFAAVESVLNGDTKPQTLSLNPGSLVLFRGRNSIHRVTPVLGDDTRMLVVLAYNTSAGVSLSESARKTFYGRLN